MITACKGIFSQMVGLSCGPVLYFSGIPFAEEKHIHRTGNLPRWYFLSHLQELERLFNLIAFLSFEIFNFTKVFCIILCLLHSPEGKDLLHDSLCLAAALRLLFASFCVFMF